MTLSGEPLEVFAQAARMIGELFAVRVVCLSEIVGEELYFRAVYVNGRVVTNAGHCPLAITPCATVERTKDVQIFDHVMERFPQAAFLRDHDAYAYCGFPALADDHRVVAVTCLLDDKPREFSERDQEVLRIFGQRIALEIERDHLRTERKHTDEDLRLARFTIEQASEAIYLINRQAQILDVNKAASAMLGYSKDELCRMTVHDINPDFHADMWPAYWADIKGKGAAVIETSHRSKDGRRIPIEINVKHLSFEGREYHCAFVRDITDRKRAEAQQMRLMAALEASLNEIYMFDTDTLRFTYVNLAARENLGYPLDVLRELTPIDLKPEFTEATFHAHIAPLLRHEQPQLVFQTVHKRANGTLYPVEVHLQLVERGHQRQFLAMIFDITDRTRAEAALRESEGRFRSAFEKTAVGMVLLNTNGRFLRANQAFCSLVGYSEDELLSKTFLEITHPEDLEKNLPTVARLMAGEIESFFVEKRYLHKLGHPVWVHASVASVRDVTGRPLNFIAQSQDITERKRAEEALRQSLERFDLAVRGAREGLWDVVRVSDDYFNPANPIYYSPRMKEIMGVEGDDSPDIIGTWAVLVHPDDRDRVFAALAAHLTRRVPYDIEYRIIKKNGECRWIAAKGQALWDEAGRPLRMAGSFSDITERKRAEEALHRSEEHLRQAQKMEAVGQLAGGVAHDFNNLLTVIIGYSRTLLTRLGADAPIRRELDQIKRSGERAAALTQQLLAFSRQQVLSPRDLDLNECIRHIQTLLQPLIGETIEMIPRLAPDLWPVRADQGQIEQALMNLVVNARDAMPHGGRLTLETRNHLAGEAAPLSLGPPPGCYVLLLVRDTGHGMDEATCARIFEPFFTTKDVGKGTGLGLAMVYGIVKQSHGHIFVDSAPGQGTTFSLYLPRVARILSAPPADHAEARSRRGSETVLLVEDNDDVRQFVRESLENEGYQVLDARSGSEALHLLDASPHPIHALIADIVMPNMSGTELGERVLARHPDIFVLYISGYTNQPIALDRAQRPRVGFIAKPFLPDKLAQALRMLLDRSA